MKSKKNLIAILCGIGIALVSLVLLIPFFNTFLISIKNYSPLKGLFGSPFAGFGNFTNFFSSPYFPKLLGNSLLISILGTFIGAVYIYVSSVAISSGKKPFLKGILTALFVIPALIPTSLFSTFLPATFMVKPSFLLTLFVSAFDGLQVAGLVVFAAFFLKGNTFKESLKCLLLFVAIRLICLLTNNVELILSIYQPLTYESLDVFSTYTFRTGMNNAEYSLTAAVQVAKIALQFFPAVIACVILIFINKTKNENAPLSDVRFLPAAVAAIAPLILFVTVLITGGSLFPAGAGEMMVSGYLFEFLYTFLSALLVTIVAYLLALATRYSKFAGCIALTILSLTANTLIGPYLMLRNNSLLNTVLAPVFMNMSMVPILALILSFILYREHSIKSNIAAFIMGFSMMFATFWGSYSNSMATISKFEMQTFSVILKRIIVDSSILGLQAKFLPLSTVPYILIPMLVVALGLLLCAIIYIIKSKKKAQ